MRGACAAESASHICASLAAGNAGADDSTLGAHVSFLYGLLIRGFHTPCTTMSTRLRWGACKPTTPQAVQHFFESIMHTHAGGAAAAATGQAAPGDERDGRRRQLHVPRDLARAVGHAALPSKYKEKGRALDEVRASPLSESANVLIVTCSLAWMGSFDPAPAVMRYANAQCQQWLCLAGCPSDEYDFAWVELLKRQRPSSGSRLRGCRDHADSFAPFLGESFHGYAAAMAREGTWGDELTLVRLPERSWGTHPHKSALHITAMLVRPTLLTGQMHGCECALLGEEAQAVALMRRWHHGWHEHVGLVYKVGPWL